MNMSHYTRGLGASVAILVLCASPSFAQDNVCGTGAAISVNLMNPTQPSTLDANYDTLIHFQQISRNLFDGLFKLDDEMQVQPNLAADYTQLDEVTYEFALRDDVVFHDGSPFTADDVVFTFDRISNDAQLASRQRTYVSNINAVEKVDDHTVRIRLNTPDASFLRVLASIIYITPKSVVESEGGVAFGTNPVGTGPFKFERWNQGDSIVLTANCDYWGDQAIPSEVEFRFISEPATQVSSLQSGEIDIATDVAPDLATGLESASGVSVQTAGGNQIVWVGLNPADGPISDERVRQALNYAVDKDAITEQLLGGYAVPVGQPYGPSIFGYTESIDPYPYDPDRARELLAEAGYADGLAIELVTHRGDLTAVWQSVAAYLGGVGIAVTTRQDPNFFVDTWVQSRMRSDQAHLTLVTNILMDADFNLGLFLDGARRGLYFNTEETDALILRARGIADNAERQAAYDQLNEILHRTAPLIYLYAPNAIYGTSDAIDWSPRPDGAIYLAGVTKTQ